MRDTIEKATARPWQAIKMPSGNWNIYGNFKENTYRPFVLTVYSAEVDDEANAELIVRAVNSFEAMRDVLKECLSAKTLTASEQWAIMARIEAALKLAEGE